MSDDTGQLEYPPPAFEEGGASSRILRSAASFIPRLAFGLIHTFILFEEPALSVFVQGWSCLPARVIQKRQELPKFPVEISPARNPDGTLAPGRGTETRFADAE